MRVKLANTIVDRVTTDAESKGLEPSWRINLLGSLYNLSSLQLRNIEPNARTLDQAHSLANAAKKAARASGVVAKALGSSTDDLVFTPMVPCRFIDTRVTGGAITTTRDFNLLETGSAYGGDSYCYLPGVGEPSFAANVTVVVAAGNAGYIGIRSYGSTNTTSFLNWSSAGAPSGLANAGIITTGKDSGSNYEFEVFNGASSSSPQVILDFFGYFAPPGNTALTCTYLTNVSSVLSAGQQTYVAPPACPSGYTAVSSYCYTSDPNTVSTGSGQGFCAWHNTGSTTSTVYENNWCCLVP